MTQEHLDQHNLEKITEAFTRAILLFPMEDLIKYKELSCRIAFIVSEEIKKQSLSEERKQLMDYWPKSVLN
jgi:hypothetical protein